MIGIKYILVFPQRNWYVILCGCWFKKKKSLIVISDQQQQQQQQHQQQQQQQQPYRRGRGGRGRGQRPQIAKDPIKVGTDFDFDTANAQYDKDSIEDQFESKLKIGKSSQQI